MSWAQRALALVARITRSWMSRAALALLVGAGLCWALLPQLAPEWVERAHRAYEAATGTHGGEIFVDGPQVYTRERLVNDRYQEDSWLNEMLRESRRVSFSYSGARGTEARNRIGMGLGQAPADAAANDRPPSEQTATPPMPGADGLPDISQAPTFRLQALRAYREQIRTLMIENQLDDRHDLRGNSLYRLRFDATILPSEGSNLSAEIRITIRPPKDLYGAPARERWRDLYKRWLGSLEQRIEDERNALWRAYRSGRFSPSDYEALIVPLRDELLQLESHIQAGAQPEFVRDLARLFEAQRPAAPQPAGGEGQATESVAQRAEVERPLERIGQCYAEAAARLAQRRQATYFPRDDGRLFPGHDGREFHDFQEAHNHLVLFDDKGRPQPFDRHPAHRTYRAVIQEMLTHRQALRAATAPCVQQTNALVTLAQFGPGVAAGTATQGGAVQSVPRMAVPVQSNARAGATPGFDTEHEQRLLIGRVFWPRIYRSVTGVDGDPAPFFDQAGVQGLDGFLPIEVPPALRDFALIGYQPLPGRRAFKVDPTEARLAVSRQPACLPDAGPNPVATEPRPVSIPVGAATYFVRQSDVADLRLRFGITVDDALLGNYRREIEDGLRSAPSQLGLGPVPGAGAPRLQPQPCAGQVTWVGIEVGLERFIQAVRPQGAVYSYAISPTEPDELIANRIRADMVRDLGLQGMIGQLPRGVGDVRAQLEAQRRLAEFMRFDTVQRSVFGFGDRRSDRDPPGPSSPAGGGDRRGVLESDASFGWRINPRDMPQPGEGRIARQQAPKQLPLTALVSLPGWWNRIDVQVERLWVDSLGRAVRELDARTYEIELPTNFEAVDASLFPSIDRGPVLLDWQIPRLRAFSDQSGSYPAAAK